jgi:hypothetical protein
MKIGQLFQKFAVGEYEVLSLQVSFLYTWKKKLKMYSTEACI